ncbi:MAG: O-antigen/teichoic acid export membrane protein [Bacteroidia bacterium]|jgi:O-antigen/teichoic acid export membrane protein
MKSLTSLAKQGVKWSMVGQVSSLVIALVSNALLSRLVAPEYFGLIATLSIFLGLLKVITNFGLGLSIIRKPRVTRSYLNTGFWINFSFDTILGLILFISAPFIAEFYNDHRLVLLSQIFAFTFFFGGLGMVPSTMLNRHLRFKSISIIQIASVIISSAFAILVAYKGYTAWALVVQVVSAALFSGIFPYFFYRWIPRFDFSREYAKDFFSFGSPLLGDSVLNYAVRNLDSFLLGRFIGIDSLAYYNKSYQIMTLPVQQISGTLKKVFYPILAKKQTSSNDFSSTYINLIRIVAFVTFPMMIGVSFCAEELILTIFGENWKPAILPLRFLAILGAIQPVASIAGLAYLLKSETKLMFRVGLISKSLMIFGIILGLKWGLIGVALGYAISSLIAALFEFYFTSKLIGRSLFNFLTQLKEPFFMTVAMGSIIFSTFYFIHTDNHLLNLFIKISVGVFSYGLILVTVYKDYYIGIKQQILRL